MVLGVTSPDPVLSLAAPIGLAANAPACLIVDLIGDLLLPKARSLADILTDGPRLEELSPGRAGIAMIPAGPIGVEEAAEVVGGLSQRWPAMVVRVPPGSWPGSTVPVIPVYPGLLAPDGSGTAVWQPSAPLTRPPGPGPVLPLLRPGLIRRLLSGRMPPRSSWISAWREVWELPWA